MDGLPTGYLLYQDGLPRATTGYHYLVEILKCITGNGSNLVKINIILTKEIRATIVILLSMDGLLTGYLLYQDGLPRATAGYYFLGEVSRCMICLSSSLVKI